MNTLLDTYLLELTNECQSVSQKLNAISKREDTTQHGMSNNTATFGGVANPAVHNSNDNDNFCGNSSNSSRLVESIVNMIDELQGAAERCDGTLNSCFAALHKEIASLQRESRRFEEHYPDLTSSIINSTAALSPVYNSTLLPAQWPSLQATPSLRHNSPRLAELRSPVMFSTSLPSPGSTLPPSASLPAALSHPNVIARTAAVTTPINNINTNVYNTNNVTNLSNEEKLQSPMALLPRTPAAARRTSQSLSISINNNNNNNNLANSAQNVTNTLLTSPSVNRLENTPITNNNNNYNANRGSEERHTLPSSSQLHHSILSSHATLPPLELSVTRGQPIADVCSPCSEPVKKFLRSHINWGAIRDDKPQSMRHIKVSRKGHHRHYRRSYSNAHDENEMNTIFNNEKLENRQHSETLPPYGMYQPATPSPPHATANTATNYYYNNDNTTNTNSNVNVSTNLYRENVTPLSATEGVNRGWTFANWRHRSLFQPRVRERSTTERSSSEEHEVRQLNNNNNTQNTQNERNSRNEAMPTNRRDNDNFYDQRMSGRVTSESNNNNSNNKSSRSRSTKETNINKLTSKQDCKNIAPTTVEEEMLQHSRKLYRPSLRSTFDTLILQQLCYDGVGLSQEMREELGCNHYRVSNNNSNEWDDSSSESSTCSSVPSPPEITKAVYPPCNSSDSLPMTEKDAELLYMEHENAIACEVRTNVFTLHELPFTWQEYNEINQWYLSAELRPKNYSLVKTIMHDTFPVTVEWLENTLLNVSFKLYKISEKVNTLRMRMRYKEKKEEEKQQTKHGQSNQSSKVVGQRNLTNITRKQQQQQQQQQVNNEEATTSTNLTTAIPVTSSMFVSATNTENNSQAINPVAHEQNDVNNNDNNNAIVFTPPTPPTYEYNDGDLYELIREVETTMETYERTLDNNSNNNNTNNNDNTIEEEDEEQQERLHSHSTEHNSQEYSTSVDEHEDEQSWQEEQQQQQLSSVDDEEEEEEQLESDEEGEEEEEESASEVSHDLLINESDVEEHDEWEYGSAEHDEIIAPVNEEEDDDEVDEEDDDGNHDDNNNNNTEENTNNEAILESGEHLITTTTTDNDDNEEEHHHTSHGNANENVSEHSSAAGQHWHTPHETSYDVNTLQVPMEHNTEFIADVHWTDNQPISSQCHESPKACKTTETKQSIEQNKNDYNITKYNTNKYIALLRHIQRRAQLLLSDLAVFCILQHLSRIVHDTTVTPTTTTTNMNTTKLYSNDDDDDKQESNASTHHLQTQVLQNVLVFIQSIQSDTLIRERVQMELETRNKLYEEECKSSSHMNIKVVYEDESYANSASISKSAKDKNAQAALERNMESANSYLLSYKHIFTFVSYISLLFTQLDNLSHHTTTTYNDKDENNKINANATDDTSGKERMLQQVAQFVHSVTPFLSLWQTHSDHNSNNTNGNDVEDSSCDVSCPYENKHNNLLSNNIRELSRVRTTPHHTSAPFGLEQSSLPHALAPIVWQENVCSSLLSEVHKIFQLEKEVLPRVQPDNRKSVEMHELMETWANRIIAESCNNTNNNNNNNTNSDMYNTYVEAINKVNSADNALARYIYPLSLPLLSELDVFYGRGLLPEVGLDENDDYDTLDKEALTKALNESSSDDDNDDDDDDDDDDEYGSNNNNEEKEEWQNRVNETHVQNRNITNEMQNFTLPPSSLPAHASSIHVRPANAMSSTEIVNVSIAQEARGNPSVPTFLSTLQVTPSSTQTAAATTTAATSRRVSQRQQSMQINDDDLQQEEHRRVSLSSNEPEQLYTSTYHQRTPEHVPLAHHPRREWAELSQHTSTTTNSAAATYAGSDVTSTTTTRTTMMNTSTNTLSSSSPYGQNEEARTFTTSAFHAPMPPPAPPALTNNTTTTGNSTTTIVNLRNSQGRTTNTEWNRGNNRLPNDEKNEKTKHKENAHAMTMELPHAIAILEARERRHKHSTRSSPSEYLQFVASALYPWSGDITSRVSAFMKDYVYSRGLCVVANAHGNLALAWKPVFRTTMCYCPVTRRRCLDPLVSGTLVKTNEQLLAESPTTSSSSAHKSMHHTRHATSEMNRMRTSITNVNTAIVEGFGQQIAEARGLVFHGVDPATGVLVLSFPDTAQPVTFIPPPPNDNTNTTSSTSRAISSDAESALREIPEMINLFLHWPSEEMPANLPVQIGTIFPMAITTNNNRNRNTTVTPLTPVQTDSSRLQQQEEEEEEEEEVEEEQVESASTHNTPINIITSAATAAAAAVNTETSESRERINSSPTLISLLSAGVSRESPHHATHSTSHGNYTSEWDDTAHPANTTTHAVQTSNEVSPPPSVHEERSTALEGHYEHVSEDAPRNASSSAAPLQTQYVSPTFLHGTRRSTSTTTTTETLHATEIASPVNRSGVTSTTRSAIPVTRSSITTTNTNIPRRTTSATNASHVHRRSIALPSAPTGTTTTTSSTPTHHRNITRANNDNNNNTNTSAPTYATFTSSLAAQTTNNNDNNNNDNTSIRRNEFTSTSREMLTRNLFSNPITERAQRLNPPDLLQCGHVISHKVLQGMCANIRQLSGETVVYCPYCRRGTTLKSVMTLSYIYEALSINW